MPYIQTSLQTSSPFHTVDTYIHRHTFTYHLPSLFLVLAHFVRLFVLLILPRVSISYSCSFYFRPRAQSHCRLVVFLLLPLLAHRIRARIAAACKRCVIGNVCSYWLYARQLSLTCMPFVCVWVRARWFGYYFVCVAIYILFDLMTFFWHAKKACVCISLGSAKCVAAHVCVLVGSRISVFPFSNFFEIFKQITSPSKQTQANGNFPFLLKCSGFWLLILEWREKFQGNVCGFWKIIFRTAKTTQAANVVPSFGIRDSDFIRQHIVNCVRAGTIFVRIEMRQQEQFRIWTK